MSFRGLVPPVRASSLVKRPFMPLARFLRDSRALLLPSSENVHGPLPARRQVRGVRPGRSPPRPGLLRSGGFSFPWRLLRQCFR